MSIERKAETDRDRFEAHYRKTRGGVPDYVFDKGLSNNRYFVLAVQLDWELWQTAVAASGRDELLEACRGSVIAMKFALSALECYHCAANYNAIVPCKQAIEEARAAIAKAKGEQ
jgi:hypothetical protein